MNQLIKPNQGGILENVTGYHWLVVIIASCGWLFDCMDQRIFILSRESALTELLGSGEAAQAAIKQYIGYATTSMILGWATGAAVDAAVSRPGGEIDSGGIAAGKYHGARPSRCLLAYGSRQTIH